MSWREDYQQGSFRGVYFRTQNQERRGGRRVAIHEFPGRDEPVTEDLGRRAREYAIECHVIGAEYRDQRDQLIDAVEAAGPGLLVHPWYGRMMVVVLDYSTTESTDDGGVCWFSISFGEAGLAAPSPVAVADGSDAARAADDAADNAPAGLASRFSIDNAAGFVEQAAADLVDGMAGIAQISAGLRGGAGPALRAFDAGLRFLPDNITSLLRAPLQLGQSLVGLVQAVALLGGNGGRRSKLASLELMLDWEPALPVFPQRTPQRRIEAANRTALLHLFRAASAAELVRAASQTDYASYDDAIATRDAVAMRLDVLALEAADRGDDDAACQFDILRRALARDVAARGASLARIYRLELAATEPALVLAHRLYGGSQDERLKLSERANAIAARNRIAHPGFIPAGVSLELLTLREASRRTAASTSATGGFR